MDAAGAGVDALAGALALLAGGGAVRFSVFAAADLTLRGVSGDCALVALAWLAGLVGAGAAAGADALEEGAVAGRGAEAAKAAIPASGSGRGAWADAGDADADADADAVTAVRLAVASVGSGWFQDAARLAGCCTAAAGCAAGVSKRPWGNST